MRIVQRVSDTSKGFAVRVGKIEPVPFEDNEKTFPELLERIAKTIKVLESVKVRFTPLVLRNGVNVEQPEDVNKDEDAEVILKTGAGEIKFTAKSMLNIRFGGIEWEWGMEKRITANEEQITRLIGRCQTSSSIM
jgi:hypothetical protein